MFYTYFRRASGMAVLFAGLSFAPGPGAAAAAGELLPRSIYIPIYFRTCEHLESALLYQADQLAGELPGRKIFQFTYYPELERIEPAVTDVRVEGQRTNGESFTARLAVTPTALYSGTRRVDLDMKKKIKRLAGRRKIDVRRETFVLKLRCSDQCERQKPRVIADSGEPSKSR